MSVVEAKEQLHDFKQKNKAAGNHKVFQSSAFETLVRQVNEQMQEDNSALVCGSHCNNHCVRHQAR